MIRGTALSLCVGILLVVLLSQAAWAAPLKWIPWDTGKGVTIEVPESWKRFGSVEEFVSYSLLGGVLKALVPKAVAQMKDALAICVAPLPGRLLLSGRFREAIPSIGYLMVVERERRETAPADPLQAISVLAKEIKVGIGQPYLLRQGKRVVGSAAPIKDGASTTGILALYPTKEGAWMIMVGAGGSSDLLDILDDIAHRLKVAL